MTHREAIKEWLSKIHLKDEEVIDWGSGSKPAFRYIQQENCQFTTADNAPGIPQDRKGYRHLDADISKPIEIDLGDRKQFDTAFCLEVLEHVENPEQLLRNIFDNLKDGGMLYLSAPFKYEIHADADYWRYTANGLRLLLERVGFQIISINETVEELGYIVEARR